MRTGRRRGALVVLEGIDGSGKSTLQRALAERWEARGWPVLLRREPNDPELGREAQLQGARDPLAGAVYFTLDRALNRPLTEAALARKVVVLQDRSYYSTIAYQASAMTPAERLAILLLQRRVSVEPDRVLWLDLSPVEALRRLDARGGPRAPLERRRTLERVRRAYRRMARPPRWAILDASQGPSTVAERADRQLYAFLRRRLGPGRAGS
jgi:dTMP kinase